MWMKKKKRKYREFVSKAQCVHVCITLECSLQTIFYPIQFTHPMQSVLTSYIVEEMCSRQSFGTRTWKKKKIKEISISDKNEFICVVSFPMCLCCYVYSYCGCYKSTRLNIMWHQMYKLLSKLRSNYNISIIKRTST